MEVTYLYNDLEQDIFRRVRIIVKKRLLASSCPSVRTEQVDFHWTDFDEI
jgi:hypothetical protein